MPSDKYFERAGASIAYQFEGSGPPLGYAHGVPLSRKAVRSLELFDFDSLGDGRSMLVYDQRGHGQSTGRPIPEDYLFRELRAGLARAPRCPEDRRTHGLRRIIARVRHGPACGHRGPAPIPAARPDDSACRLDA